MKTLLIVLCLGLSASCGDESTKPKISDYSQSLDSKVIKNLKQYSLSDTSCNRRDGTCVDHVLSDNETGKTFQGIETFKNFCANEQAQKKGEPLPDVLSAPVMNSGRCPRTFKGCFNILTPEAVANRGPLGLIMWYRDEPESIGQNSLKAVSE